MQNSLCAVISAQLKYTESSLILDIEIMWQMLSDIGHIGSDSLPSVRIVGSAQLIMDTNFIACYK